MISASRPVVKLIAKPALNIFEAFIAAMIEPGKYRRERFVGCIQKDTVVHESSDADRIDGIGGVRNLERANGMFEARNDVLNRKRRRGFPLGFGGSCHLQV